jgi:uncharacterized protein (TIGR03792 family)
MVIEWLRVVVTPALRERYIQTDAEIWTAALSRYRGFLGKEVWINPTDIAEVVLVIRWATREDWKSIPEEELAEIEREFNAAMGEGTHQIVESREYQVRKFRQ